MKGPFGGSLPDYEAVITVMEKIKRDFELQDDSSLLDMKEMMQDQDNMMMHEESDWTGHLVEHGSAAIHRTSQGPSNEGWGPSSMTDHCSLASWLRAEA